MKHLHLTGREVVVWTQPADKPSRAINMPAAPVLHGPTLGDIARQYQTDPLSTFHKLRFHVRRNHEGLLRRIIARHGSTPLSEITGRTLIAWHAEWASDGKVAMGHAFTAQIRTLCGFGFTLLADRECERLCLVLNKMRFAMAPSRVDRLTAEQVEAVRMWAHIVGWHSIALAQAFQFELMLRQKDVIGEWVPKSETGTSDVVWHGQKWLRGIRWSEISDDLILTHITSKRQKPIVVDLKLAPMVMEELEFLDEMPDDEPVIMCESTCMPYATPEFRRKWRIVANYAGIPENVRNMDSRSGAISEAFAAGVNGERIQKSATHSDIGMTQKYNRGDAMAASSEVQLGRVAARHNAARDGESRDARWHRVADSISEATSTKRRASKGAR
jgi:hypothetical protein